MERLELSKQKLLGPKSSASTNFATSANPILLIVIYIYILNDKLSLKGCCFMIQCVIKRSP